LPAENNVISFYLNIKGTLLLH